MHILVPGLLRYSKRNSRETESAGYGVLYCSQTCRYIKTLDLR